METACSSIYNTIDNTEDGLSNLRVPIDDLTSKTLRGVGIHIKMSPSLSPSVRAEIIGRYDFLSNMPGPSYCAILRDANHYMTCSQL